MAGYRNMSIKTRLFLMIILSMVLVIVLAFSSMYYAYSIYDKQLYDKSYRLLNLSSSTIDVELQKLEAMSLSIISDQRIQQNLKELMGDSTEFSSYILRTELTDRIWAHISTSERYVQSIHLIDGQHRMNQYGSTVVFPEDKYASMLAKAEFAHGSAEWVYPDDSDPMLIMIRQVRAYEPMTLEPIGFLIVRINIDRLVQDYTGTTNERSDIVLKSGDHIVYPYQATSAGASDVLQSLEEKDGYAIKEVDGEAVFLSQKKSAYTNWMYYNVVPYNAIFEKTVWLKNTMIVFYLLAIAIVVTFGMLFARSLTKPIRQLIAQMKEVQNGDLDSMESGSIVPVSQHLDEVGLLQRTYRMMITRINTLIKENYANELIIKETEFKALQAQINPHFLYNTLDSINWLAKKNKQSQIASMVVSLGYLLRSSISLKKNVITVGEELDIVNHYIKIQKYRFQDRLDFHLEVPEKYQQVHVPKLTLQPLLENAIQYGLEPMIQACTIRVYAEPLGDKLALVVEDHGPGMEATFLQKVMKGEVETRGTGIGLMNIRDRLKLAFGDDYDIQIESAEGRGTKVLVLLPLPQEDQL